MKKKCIIIDGHAIIHRAYHALPPLTAKDGTVVNAVFGFSSMLLKVITELKPHYLAVSFDVSGGTFRDEIYEDYKATREKADQDLYDQIPLVYEVVEAFDIPIYEQEGFEADDVIGTVSNIIKTKHKDVQTIIVTGDQDMLQLVDDDVVDVYLLRKGVSDFSLFNEAAVKEKFGFGPEYIVDYKALKGDSSDNIPGVKGVGDKTAKQLIDLYGTVEEMYDQIKNQKSKIINETKESIVKKLEADKDNAFMSKDLATIRQDVKKLGFNIKDCVTHEFDVKAVEDLFKKFEFYSLLKRLPGGSLKSKVISQKSKTPKRRKIITVDDTNVDNVLVDIKKEKQFACQAITNGENVLENELLGFVFVTYNNAYYIELSKLHKTNQEKLFSVFSTKSYTVVGHDLKPLIKILNLQSSIFNLHIFDVQVASYILNSSTRAHDLKSVVLRELGHELSTSSDQATLFGADPQQIAEELSATLEIKSRYEKKLEETNNKKLFETMEMPLIPVLAHMEMLGVAVDTKKLAELSKHAAQEIKKLTKNIHKEAGEEFNIASSVQLREVLYEKLELPTQGIKKGKTGYSTAASELEKLAGLHPIITMIGEFREIEKLRNTYIDVLPTLMNKTTGRIHTTYNQTVAATGRLSSADPNLQNIPIRTKLGKQVRDAFVSEKGYNLVAIDYSQIELRIAASIANDKTMIDIFESGEDIHSATAAVLNDVDLKKVTKDMRRAAKAINFGILYGMGAFGLAARTGFTQFEAKEFIDKYFERFTGIRKYMKDTINFAKKNGYVETLFNRRRYIPELTSGNHQLKRAGERMAINMPIQGTQADMIKLAMIQIHDWIQASGKQEDIKMLLQVHDELVFEMKDGKEKPAIKKITDIMEQVTTLKVPIIAEAHIGKQWGELK